jgi:hypothetical protein
MAWLRGDGTSNSWACPTAPSKPWMPLEPVYLTSRIHEGNCFASARSVLNLNQVFGRVDCALSENELHMLSIPNEPVYMSDLSRLVVGITCLAL